MKARGQITRNKQIRRDLAVAMIQGIRKAVLGSMTDEEIFEADQRKLENYHRILRKL